MAEMALAKAVLLACVYLPLHVFYPLVHMFWFVLLQPVRLISKKLYWRVEGVLFEIAIVLASLHIVLPGQKVYESGDDLSRIPCGDAVLAMPNHQNLLDVPMMLTVLQKRRLLRITMFIMDWWFKYVHFGFLSYCHGACFIRKATKHPNDKRYLGPRLPPSLQIRHDVNEAVINGPIKWIVLFPEGGFLHKKKAADNRFAQKSGLPLLTNVNWPFVSGAFAVVDTLGGSSSEVKWIVDVTIGYKGEVRPLPFIFAYDGIQETEVHYRVFPMSDVCGDSTSAEETESRLKAWMYKLYREKDEILRHFYENGSFPVKDQQMRRHRRSLIDYKLVLAAACLAFTSASIVYHTACFILL